jgi:hypothetical protein
MNSSDARFAFRSPFDFDLTDPHDILTAEEFLRIEGGVSNWSQKTGIPYEIERTKKGFRVSLSHPVADGDAFGMSLFFHLARLFEEMEAEQKDK